jgi:molecular chaperone GrpE
MKEDQDTSELTTDLPVPEGNSADGRADQSGHGEVMQHEPATPDEVAELRGQAARARENWDRFVRLNADFDNFKKRAAKDRLDAIKYANEALIEKLLPVVDNFEAALAAGAGTETPAVNSLVAGVKMIATQLKGVLAESGLEEIDALGKPFDPTIHEALSPQASADVPEGQVLQQVRKGYRLKERLVRPAAVVVATRPGAAGTGE